MIQQIKKKGTKDKVEKKKEGLFDVRNKIIEAFEDGTFSLNKEQAKKDKVDRETKEIDLSWIYRPVNELKEFIKEVDKYDVSE